MRSQLNASAAADRLRRRSRTPRHPGRRSRSCDQVRRRCGQVGSRTVAGLDRPFGIRLQGRDRPAPQERQCRGQAGLPVQSGQLTLDDRSGRFARTCDGDRAPTGRNLSDRRENPVGRRHRREGRARRSARHRVHALRRRQGAGRVGRVQRPRHAGVPGQAAVALVRRARRPQLGAQQRVRRQGVGRAASIPCRAGTHGQRRAAVGQRIVRHLSSSKARASTRQA